jgi:hypothetical protein
VRDGATPIDEIAQGHIPIIGRERALSSTTISGPWTSG